MTPRLAVLLALLLLLPAAAAAQTVRGTFVDHDTGEPVAGGRVVLRDAEGHEAASGHTDASGAYELRAGADGTYTLRGERIGFAPTTSPPLSLAAGRVTEYRLVAGTQRVMLDAITARSEGSRCVVRPGAGMQAAVLWEEARKALQNARATSETGTYRYTAQHFRTELDAHTRVVRHAVIDTLTGQHGDPFVTLPVARLAAEGYVHSAGDTLIFYAPDAAALLSPTFLDQHCFRLQDPPPGREGQIGLAFEPTRERRLPDVRGTLWLDRRTAELRKLEYQYTGVGVRRPSDEAGGSMEFRRLPAGTWIISRWRIRMPVLTAERLKFSERHTIGGEGLRERTRTETVAFLAEDGGEVTALFTRFGQPVAMEGGARAAGARLSGTVFDSTRAAPLAGATVRAEGTAYAASTDAAGRYEMPELPDGTYSLTFSGARLDTLRYAPLPVRVTVAGRAAVPQNLAIPSMPRLLAVGCGDSAAIGGTLVGLVRGDSAAPVVGASVTATWPGGERVAESDYRGIYRLCGGPVGVPLGLRMTAQGVSMAVADVRLAPGAPVQQDFALPPRLAATDGASGRTAGAAGLPLHGRVVASATGRPVAGATVRLGSALAPRTTDAAGGFVFPRVPAGTYAVTVTHLDFGPRTVTAAIGGDGPEMELRLPARGDGGSLVAVLRSPVRLAAVRATARRGSLESVGFVARQRQGAGVFITPEKMDRYRGSPLSSLLRAVPGVRIIEYQPPPRRIKAYTPPKEHRVQPTRGGEGMRLGCFMSVYLDGVEVQSGSPYEGNDIDANILTGIKAVEVYRGLSEIPPEYRGSRCGVILLWSRDAEDHSRPVN
jgi:hypothetical protein